ncbi:MAG: hypothetical protein IJC50_00230 [Clostridia bacterium]|nr:hypothetical protein [Clostridia bacterium]
MGILSFFKRDTDMNSPKMIRLLITEKLAVRREAIELMHASVDAESFFYGYNVWLKSESEITDILIEHPSKRWYKEFPEIGFFNSNGSVRSKYQIDFIRRACLEGADDMLKEDIEKYLHYLTDQAKDYFENNVAPLKSVFDPNKEYIFCSVVFDNGTDLYDYLTDDETIRPMDKVRVPVGIENKERTAKVIRVLKTTADNSPYPFEKLKTVISKIND